MRAMLVNRESLQESSSKPDAPDNERTWEKPELEGNTLTRSIRDSAGVGSLNTMTRSELEGSMPDPLRHRRTIEMEGDMRLPGEMPGENDNLNSDADGINTVQ